MGVRDENFLCACGGTYVLDAIGKNTELRGFHCDMCGRFALECPVCRKPRMIFVRNYERCKFCDDNYAGLTEIFKALIDQTTK